MRADEHYEARMRAWAEPAGLEFATPQAALAYRERVRMLRDAIELRRPVRVPISPWVGLFPARRAGLTARDAYYDHERSAAALADYHWAYGPDTLAGFSTIVPGRVLDILDYRMYDWPGHGTSDEAGYQYKDAEYMMADEYPWLMADPSAFWQSRHVPRMFGALEPLRHLASFTDLVEIPSVATYMMPYGLPQVQQMLKALMAAGDVTLEWQRVMSAAESEVIADCGIPRFGGAMTKAPYDILGDTLRGTRGVMIDKFRRRADVIEAMERLVPIAVEAGRRAADITRNPFVFMPLHKGADDFLSDADFRGLYWPTLKAVLVGLIEDGLVPKLFVEGSYNDRLEVIVDDEIPAGRTIWLFDATDMVAVREHLAGWTCFGGNVPGALLSLGEPDAVRDYVRRLIDDVAADGGFILSTGIPVDDAREENFAAMMEAGRRYGGEG